MTIIVNTSPNASTNVNGIEFAPDEQGRMCSVAPVTGEMLVMLLAIPGFSERDPAPAITGTVSASGALTANIPMPDGSTLNLQATGPADANPILQATEGIAAQLVADHAAGATDAGAGAQEDAAAGAEQPAAKATRTKAAAK